MAVICSGRCFVVTAIHIRAAAMSGCWADVVYNCKARTGGDGENTREDSLAEIERHVPPCCREKYSQLVLKRVGL